MRVAANHAPPDQGTPYPAQWPAHPEIEAHQPRNLLLLAAHQIVLRVGWIFKTESVIMPAFLDWIAGPGAGWLRGCMPVLNRAGQSLPPVFCAARVRATRYKKLALATFVILMSLPFGILSGVCLAVGDRRMDWMPALFLTLYGTFFFFNGLYLLSFGTTQGKLIQPTRRGRLLLISTAVGTVPAMLLAWQLLPMWLKRSDGGYGYIFAFTAVCFFFSGMTALLLFEPADGAVSVAKGDGNLRETWRALRADRNLRRLVGVAMLFGSGLIIFPHYQALALGPLQLPVEHLMLFVITQNAAVGIYSLFVGPLADALGNRLTLRGLVFGSALAPLFAISLAHVGSPTGARLFWLVFIPLGVTPLVLRILINYALEICTPSRHARYISTVSLFLATPFVLSPLVGWLVDATGFDPVFLATAGVLLLSGCLTFGLDEPRHRAIGAEVGTAGVGGED